MRATLLLFSSCFLCSILFAQLRRPAPPGKKIDSLKLLCPVPGAVAQSAPQEGYGYKGDLKVIFKSIADTLFLAPVDGKVDLVAAGEGGRYEIVMYYYNYNLWFTGISKPLVKKDDKLTKGQPIGKINPGEEVELLLFDDEEPVDPKKFLDCKTK